MTMNEANIIANNKLSKHSKPAKVFPERIIQFGTGVLLRGLVDYSIQNANDQDCFKGSIVMVKSTKSVGESFEDQDCMYHLAVRGFEFGLERQSYQLNQSISRTVNANTQWEQFLELAAKAELDIIVSNTTEAGLVLNPADKISAMPPSSFPCKLLALLQRRFLVFGGDFQKGYTIIPTELISNNGKVLQAVVLELAKLNSCTDVFMDWIVKANNFCSSLVDRIVTGKPDREKMTAHWHKLGMTDNLLIECEPYLLWAIEGNEAVQEKLSFALPNSGVVVANDIDRFKELKLRLLNGTHSFLAAKAFFEDFVFVKDAMKSEAFLAFTKALMHEEIAPSLNLPIGETTAYAHSIVDRFSNRFIDHFWINITLNYTQKMMLRNYESVARYHQKFGKLPWMMVKCFAYYLRFMQPVRVDEQNNYFGNKNGEEYLINDPLAQHFFEFKENYGTAAFVSNILSKKEIWVDADFESIPNFTNEVIAQYLNLT